MKEELGLAIIGLTDLSKVSMGHRKFRQKKNLNPRTLGQKNEETSEGHWKFR
jgi:hypothetical protein